MYAFSYDAENRLTSVSAAHAASYTYHGDGQRIKMRIGVMTAYIGNYDERTASGAKSYYQADDVRVAQKDTLRPS